MKTFAAIWTAISLLPTWATAAPCEDILFEGTGFTVCQADPAQDQIRLFLNDREGARLGTFDSLAQEVKPSSLTWAMNGGMYHPDRLPVGLYIEDGEELTPIVTREGPGNFGLLPNGILCIGDGFARVIESHQFNSNRPACKYATQSGPMLVIDGELHPRFLPASDSLNIRNGVGITEGGQLYAAISKSRVNFHQFARLFRDVLKTPNALFLDGRISRLYAPTIDRHDIGFPLGPMLGVITP